MDDQGMVFVEDLGVGGKLRIKKPLHFQVAGPRWQPPMPDQQAARVGVDYKKGVAPRVQ
jgi:hypothetical protein